MYSRYASRTQKVEKDTTDSKAGKLATFAGMAERVGFYFPTLK